MHQSSGAATQVLGKFQVNVLDGKVDDPWNRSYMTAPQFNKADRVFPLNDFRDEVFGISPCENWSYPRSAELLRKYGFTAVKIDISKHTISKGEKVETIDFDDLDVLEEIYYPQVKESLLKLTGAKEVFITNSIVRTGESERQANGSTRPENASAKQPLLATAAVPAPKSKDEPGYKALHENRPTHLSSSDNAKPSRTPHMDYTPLGARRSIRCWRPDIRRAAIAHNVIPAEDDICAAAGIHPQSHASDAILSQDYNPPGALGPRYAAYSVWRPLRTVTRDPLAMAPRATFSPDSFSPYYLKVLAAPSMGGDFLRELEALATTTGKPDAPAQPRWYYLAEQQPDEMIVLKFFDSAALHGGEGYAEEAPGVPHASPDIGDAAYGLARQSIEVRCICFW